MLIKGGVKFNEVEEKRCPKASPLTLSRVCKAPVESEKGESREKTRKRMRARPAKEPKELALVTVSEEEANGEEKGDFEAYAEQPMLSPTIDQGESAEIRVEERGK